MLVLQGIQFLPFLRYIPTEPYFVTRCGAASLSNQSIATVQLRYVLRTTQWTSDTPLFMVAVATQKSNR